MPSLVSGFEYDIFISYRQNDNRPAQGFGGQAGSGWVTEFVKALQEELAATIKDPISVYFDTNPHDGLLETHNVDKTLEGKLKCLIFIPIVSQTYCDSKSFAWQHEFCAFNKLAKEDQFGRDIKLSNGNVTSRILPVKIHDLDPEDVEIVEKEIGGIQRPIEFIFKSPGVNRPLAPNDNPDKNQNKTFYRDQVNKVANAIKGIITSIKNPGAQARISVSKPVTIPSRKGKVFISSIIVLLILSASAYFLYPKLITSTEGLAKDKSIAVLPFVNMSNDPEQEYFSDGITEEILNTLAKIKDLKVAGRTSSFQYKGKNEDLKEIGRALGVAYILEGSVRKVNHDVRITAQLIDAENGFHLWSEEYNDALQNIFKLQEQVSLDIARTLSDKLGVSGGLKANQISAINTTAYDYYLKGRQLFMKRKNLEEAARMFKLSIQHDSTFSLAYSGLAASLVLNSSFIVEMDGTSKSQETVRRLQEECLNSAEKAIKIDASNAEAFSALGLLNGRKKNWKAARQNHEKSLSLNASNATANLWFGLHLYTMGHFSEALGYFEKAVEQEPLYSVNYLFLSRAYMAMGNFEPGFNYGKKGIALGSKDDGYYTYFGYYILFSKYVELGRWDELNAFISGSPDLTTGHKTIYLQLSEICRTKNKQRLVELDTANNLNLSPEVYFWVGDYEKAMQMLLEQADLEQALWAGRKELRKLQGFKTAAINLGYLDYWKEYGGPDVCPTISEGNFVCP